MFFFALPMWGEGILEVVNRILFELIPFLQILELLTLALIHSACSSNPWFSRHSKNAFQLVYSLLPWNDSSQETRGAVTTVGGLSFRHVEAPWAPMNSGWGPDHWSCRWWGLALASPRVLYGKQWTKKKCTDCTVMYMSVRATTKVQHVPEVREMRDLSETLLWFCMFSGTLVLATVFLSEWRWPWRNSVI